MSLFPASPRPDVALYTRATTVNSVDNAAVIADERILPAKSDDCQDAARAGDGNRECRQDEGCGNKNAQPESPGKVLRREGL